MNFQWVWAWRDRTTWPARVRSASRRAGRARTSHGCLLLVLPMRLACAVGAIAGVAKTRQDIGIDVEAVVDCGCPDWHLRMDAAQTFEALRRTEQANEADVLGAALLEPVDGSDCRIGGGEHGGNDNDEALGDVGAGAQN